MRPDLSAPFAVIFMGDLAYSAGIRHLHVGELRNPARTIPFPSAWHGNLNPALPGH